MTSPLVERDWRVLLDNLERKNCVVLLGPALLSKGPTGESRNFTIELSRSLADALEHEERVSVQDPDNLPLVAQEFLERKTRIDLEVEVAAFYQKVDSELAAGPSGDPAFEDLAALPVPLFVSSRHDPILPCYLDARGRTPIEENYDFTGSQQRTLGELGTPGRPMIYQLFGTATNPPSLVLTESDRLDLLEAIVSGNPALPVDLQNRFREKSFLFLGCGLHDFYHRFLLYVLGLSRSGQRSFALEPVATAKNQEDLPGTFSESVWFYAVEYRTLKFLEMEGTEFLREIRRRWKKRHPRWEETHMDWSRSNGSNGPGDSPQAPTVFVSYMKEDREIADQLAASLEDEGIEPWIDHDDIGWANHWDQSLEDAIGKDCDFFIVLLSRHLRDGVETYVHREVGAALKRASMRGAVKFLYPVQIDEKAELLDAIDRARIQARRLKDFGAGVTNLATDIKREFAKLRRR